ncbi:MAG: DUF4197 family protein, partial [Prolixibacteraceae bacterium]|nr:DUF4197 family protein [Prolixibacteraceae bacterium]
MKKAVFLSLIICILSLTSCDILLQLAETAVSSDKPLTTTEVVQGLKEALKVGTDTAVVRLGKTDGYYLDKLIKINLPPETAEVI